MGSVCDLERSILLIISRTLPGGRSLSLSGEPLPLLAGEPLALGGEEVVGDKGEEASSCAGEGAIVVESSGGVGVGGRMFGDSACTNNLQSSSVFGGVLWAINCVRERERERERERDNESKIVTASYQEKAYHCIDTNDTKQIVATLYT